MDSDIDLDDFSDDGIDDKSHAKLLNEVSKLGKPQYVKKSTRTEPTTKISEYNLVKLTEGKSIKLNVKNLTKKLKTRSKHAEIANKIDKVFRESKTLSKPLEKPQAEKIRRTVGFAKATEELKRWDAVVTRNRASDNQTFPLASSKLDENNKKYIPGGFRLKSELQLEMEKLQPKEEVYEIEDEFPLSLEEILERRREMAKLRAHQSYKEAKARRQNKIKSKKFHRILRREKTKQQFKEFEELQKINPEEALRKLEEIEKARAEERVSLRHKSTGKWAKNKLVRAKYDKEARQVLSEQLKVSKELTQKINAENSSDSEVELDIPISKQDSNNPWVKNFVKTNQDVNEFLSGYKKFWEKTNNAKETTNEQKKENEAVEETIVENNALEVVNIAQENKEAEKRHVAVEETSKAADDALDVVETKKIGSDAKEPTAQLTVRREKNVVPTKKTKNKGQKPNSGTTEFVVEDIPDEKDVNLDGIFDGLTKKIQANIGKKMKSLKNTCNLPPINDGVSNKPNRKRNRNNDTDLSFPLIAKRPIIDEEIITDGNDQKQSKIDAFKQMLNDTASDKSKDKTSGADNIDPNKFIEMKPVVLATELPDLMNYDDNEENDNAQRHMISEAFQDDDVVNEFRAEKKKEIDADKPVDVDLNLPGWGSWAGKSINVSKRKQRRFMVKFPEQMKRRDDNVGQLIINEKVCSKLKPHLVSELPFPFTTVKDFEASIRAPIGNTFITEKAHRKLIIPAVRTKMGTVIEPMNEGQLLRKKKTGGNKNM